MYCYWCFCQIFFHLTKASKLNKQETKYINNINPCIHFCMYKCTVIVVFICTFVLFLSPVTEDHDIWITFFVSPVTEIHEMGNTFLSPVAEVHDIWITSLSLLWPKSMTWGSHFCLLDWNAWNGEHIFVYCNWSPWHREHIFVSPVTKVCDMGNTFLSILWPKSVTWGNTFLSLLWPKFMTWGITFLSPITEVHDLNLEHIFVFPDQSQIDGDHIHCLDKDQNVRIIFFVCIVKFGCYFCYWCKAYYLNMNPSLIYEWIFMKLDMQLLHGENIIPR